MLAVDKAWPGIARQKNSTLFLTSALISSAATGAFVGWEAMRGRKKGKGLLEQFGVDTAKARRFVRSTLDRADALTANYVAPLRRPIIPFPEHDEDFTLQSVGPPMDDSGHVYPDSLPFQLAPPEEPLPTHTIRLVDDKRVGTTNDNQNQSTDNWDVATIQPEDQIVVPTRRSRLAQLPHRSLEFMRSIPFRFAAWREIKRDMKILDDVEYHYRHTPMGYNE